MQHFKYGKKETDFLKTQDKRLGEAIDKIGFIKREVNPNIVRSPRMNNESILCPDDFFNRIIAIHSF